MNSVIVVTELKTGNQRAYTTLSKAAKALKLKPQTIRDYMSRNKVRYYNTPTHELVRIPVG